MKDCDPDPNLQVLADWFDRHGQTGIAEGIRDWHLARDGNWRDFALYLASALPELKLAPEDREQANRLLRTPRCRLREAIQVC